MRRFVPSLLVVAAALAGPSLSGATESSSFGELHNDLVYRRDNLYGGTLDKTQKKQLAAVNKAIEALEAPSDGIGDDGKTLSKVVKGIVKAFPADFVVSSIPLPFPYMFGRLMDDFWDEIENQADGIATQVGGLSLKGAAKVGKLLDQVEEGLAEADAATDYVSLAKGLSKAATAVGKAQGVVENDPGPPVGVNVTVDGANLKPGTVTCSFHEQTGLLTFTATKTGLTTTNVTVSAGTEGTGTYGLSVGSVQVIHVSPPGAPENFTLINGGTLVVTAYDSASNTVSFNFDFTAPGSEGTAGSRHVVGSYSGPYIPAGEL